MFSLLTTDPLCRCKLFSSQLQGDLSDVELMSSRKVKLGQNIGHTGVVGHFLPSSLAHYITLALSLPPSPPLSPEKKWNLLRVSPENLKTYQTFPSGKRVSPQERQKRDRYFEFRA